MSAPLGAVNSTEYINAACHAFCAPGERALPSGIRQSASDHSRCLRRQPALAGTSAGSDRAARERRGAAALCQCRSVQYGRWLHRVSVRRRRPAALRAALFTARAMPEYQQEPDANQAPRYMPGGPDNADQAHAAMDPKYLKQVVDYDGGERAGTIVIDTPHKFLYLVKATARRCATASASASPASPGPAKRRSPTSANGRTGRRRPEMLSGGPICRATWQAVRKIRSARAPCISAPRSTASTVERALDHRQAVSSGCIRMRNEDVIDSTGASRSAPRSW